MNEKQKYYITTPIYYPSDKLHVGHTYTTVAADIVARFKRMQGFDVMFATGTDEHGQKIQRKAEAAGVTPQAYVDHIVAGIKDLWATMDITYDRFIRTTDEHHVKAIQTIFQKLYNQGDIYKSTYKGLYCTPCESFWTQSQLVDGKCPDCGRAVEETTEEAYFFRLSKYQDAIIRHMKDNPSFLQPESRTNEMLNNFLEPGLEDLCVSRSTFDWGIPVPFDEGHVVYVWIDALSNYLTLLGYPEDASGDVSKYWPCDVHLVGKEIVRFHAIIWPAMLMALGMPLPTQVFGHGWLLFGGSKMSKSKGNVADPAIFCSRYGVDALRYFLAREVQFGSDGQFTSEAFLQRIQTDLSNDLGNLVSRTAAMIEKYFDGVLPQDRLATDADQELMEMVKALPAIVSEQIDCLHFSVALSEMWKVISRANKYIDENAPWVLAKNEMDRPRLAQVLFMLAESLRVIAILLTPFMPSTPEKIFANLGIEAEACKSWDSSKVFGLYGQGEKVKKTEAIFPRPDLEKELEELAKIAEASSPTVEEPVVPTSPAKADIVYDDFAKVELLVGKVLESRRVEGADKLLVSQVDIGRECRTIVSGIAPSYDPADLVGTNVTVVANLAPKKIRGVLSHGMLLCAEVDGRYRLLRPDADAVPGTVIA